MTTIRSKACRSSVSGDGLGTAAAGHRDCRSTSYCGFIAGQRLIASVIPAALQPILNYAAVVARRRSGRSTATAVVFVSWDARETRQRRRQKKKTNKQIQCNNYGVKILRVEKSRSGKQALTRWTKHSALDSGAYETVVIIIMTNGKW